MRGYKNVHLAVANLAAAYRKIYGGEVRRIYIPVFS